MATQTLVQPQAIGSALAQSRATYGPGNWPHPLTMVNLSEENRRHYIRRKHALDAYEAYNRFLPGYTGPVISGYTRHNFMASYANAQMVTDPSFPARNGINVRQGVNRRRECSGYNMLDAWLRKVREMHAMIALNAQGPPAVAHLRGLPASFSNPAQWAAAQLIQPAAPTLQQGLQLANQQPLPSAPQATQPVLSSYQQPLPSIPQALTFVQHPVQPAVQPNSQQAHQAYQAHRHPLPFSPQALVSVQQPVQQNPPPAQRHPLPFSPQALASVQQPVQPLVQQNFPPLRQARRHPLPFSPQALASAQQPVQPAIQPNFPPAHQQPLPSTPQAPQPDLHAVDPALRPANQRTLSSAPAPVPVPVPVPAPASTTNVTPLYLAAVSLLNIKAHGRANVPTKTHKLPEMFDIMYTAMTDVHSQDQKVFWFPGPYAEERDQHLNLLIWLRANNIFPKAGNGDDDDNIDGGEEDSEMSG